MDLTVGGFLLAAIGILVTIAIAIRQRRPKRVVYEVLTNRQIIARTAYQTTGALAITYGDRNLKDPHLIVIRIANGGKVEIRPDDWEEPLSLGSDSEIIDSGVVGQSSKDLQPEIAGAESHQIWLSKILLNQGEWYDVQMLIDGTDGVSVSARIAGARLEAKRTRVGTNSIRTWLRHFSSLSSTPIALPSITAVITVIALIVFFLTGGLKNLSPPTSRVPQLIGMPLSQVVQELHRAKLHLGAERFVPDSGPVGIVIDQDPGVGSEVDVGGEVSVVISQHG